MGWTGRSQTTVRLSREVPTMSDPTSRSGLLDRAIADLLAQAPEVEAAAVVSFDGLPMASALPATMDEDRVAAMSAALLSLGERAAEGLGRGGLSQVYIEGDAGTVFLVSCDDEAVLVAVAAKGAKVGMMLYEVRRAAETVAAALRQSDLLPDNEPAPVAAVEPPSYDAAPAYTPTYDAPAPAPAPAPAYETPNYGAPATTWAEPATTYAEPAPAAGYAPASSESAWPSYLPNGAAPNGIGGAEPTTNWS
jgi:predicted regulator of Ras-like GTPase activity (Roadblock/LC7/MglB family)